MALAERLDKILASQGLGTRSEVARMVRAGRVVVDGVIAGNPAAKLDPQGSEILVNGLVMDYRRHLYLMMNKPAGLLCVSSDPRAETVISVMPGVYKRPGLFPAGRLDKDTTGLVIITDDGDFAHSLTAPKKDIVKTYHAVLDGAVGEREIEAFAAGITLEDGTVCRTAGLRVLEPGEQPLVEIRITEGRYHQIKRMSASVGKMVLSLKRTAIGGLFLGDTLQIGEYCELNDEMKARLFEN